MIYTGPIAGDVGFAHNHGGMGRLIRIGEWIRLHRLFKKYRRRDEWNHEFVVDRVVDGVAYIIQATLEGVTDSARLDEVAPGGHYVTMSPPEIVDRDKLLAFCRAQVNIRYGILTDVAIGIDLITWDWVPSLRSARYPTWQCAALINEGLRFGGWFHNWPSVYDMTPQEGYDALVMAKVEGE